MMKIALVLAIARYYQWLPPKKVSWPYARAAAALMIGAPIILALDQPDLGTAALFAIIGGGLAVPCRGELVLFRGGIVGVIVALPHVWERCTTISGSGF